MTHFSSFVQTVTSLGVIKSLTTVETFLGCFGQNQQPTETLPHVGGGGGVSLPQLIDSRSRRSSPGRHQCN